MQAAKSCLPWAASAADAGGVRSSNATDKLNPRSRMHQGPWIFHIAGLDLVGGPQSHRPQSAGGVVAMLLRESAGAHHKQIVRVPALQIAVHHAVAGIAPHDGAA